MVLFSALFPAFVFYDHLKRLARLGRFVSICSKPPAGGPVLSAPFNHGPDKAEAAHLDGGGAHGRAEHQT